MNALRMMMDVGRRRKALREAAEARAERNVEAVTPHPTRCAGHLPLEGKAFGRGSIRAAAKALGVTDVAVGSWMKRHGCTLEEAVEHYRERQRRLEGRGENGEWKMENGEWRGRATRAVARQRVLSSLSTLHSDAKDGAGDEGIAPTGNRAGANYGVPTGDGAGANYGAPTGDWADAIHGVPTGDGAGVYGAHMEAWVEDEMTEAAVNEILAIIAEGSQI